MSAPAFAPEFDEPRLTAREARKVDSLHRKGMHVNAPGFWEQFKRKHSDVVCAFCGRSLYGFNSGAIHCSEVCKKSTKRRREGAGTPERKWSQLDGLRETHEGQSWRAASRQDAGTRDADSADDNSRPSRELRTVLRCVECAAFSVSPLSSKRFPSTPAERGWLKSLPHVEHDERQRDVGCGCGAPTRELPVLHDGLKVKTEQPDSSGWGDKPEGLTFDPVWEAVRYQGATIIIHRKHRIQRGTASTGYRYTDEPWMLPDDVESLQAEIDRHHEHAATAARSLDQMNFDPTRTPCDSDSVSDDCHPAPSLRRATAAARRTNRLRVPNADGDA